MAAAEFEDSDDSGSDSDEETCGDGHYLCYLMVNFLPKQKINTHVGKSRDPVRKVVKHNLKLTKGPKTTRAAAPHWQLEMAAGPFVEKLSAKQFKRAWKQKSRGIPSRRKRGMRLSKDHRVLCYDVRLKRKVPEQ